MLDIAILGVDELNDFRTIRLSALAKAPAMFGSTYALEVIKPSSFFQSWLSGSVIFGGLPSRSNYRFGDLNTRAWNKAGS